MIEFIFSVEISTKLVNNKHFLEAQKNENENKK